MNTALLETPFEAVKHGSSTDRPILSGASDCSGLVEPVHIISLGAGVQSSTMALMAACGELTPMPTAAIFADTQAEPASVYKWLDWLETQLPFPVYRVTAGSLTERVTTTRTNRKTGNIYYSNMIPAMVLNQNGTKGIAGRSCTLNFKIDPIVKKLREIIGRQELREWRKVHASPLNEIREHEKRKLQNVKTSYPADAWKHCHANAMVVQWIGISLDEVQRMKPSRDVWSRHEWPLVDKRMKRHDCLEWMKSHGFPTPPRSACCYCPFHSDNEWRRLRDIEPDAFAEAVRVEKAMQAVHSSVTTPGKFKGIPYLHASLVPLDQVDFSTDKDHGQQDLFNNECEGMCGI
jgi:hypothetical protein